MVVPRTRPTVERKIYFYRANIGYDEGGHLLPFDPAPTLKHVDTLPWSGDGRYWTADDGKVTCCWVDSIGSSSKLRFGYSRRSDLPQIEQSGNLSPLNIPAQSGLAEQIHVIFFRKNIVGADFNFYGPRINRLAYYLSERAQGIIPEYITFEHLLRQDVAEQLERIGHIRLFRLKLMASFATQLAEADQSLSDAFRAAERASEAEELEILLKPAPYSRGWLSDGVLETAKRILGLPGLRNGVNHFTVKGYDRVSEKITTLDLLNDKLIAKRRIVRLDDRSRALDSNFAYAAIEDAYEELEDELITAAGIGT